MINQETLFLAWVKVRQNDGCAGVDGVTIDQFNQCLVQHLSELQQQVDSGQYRPQALLRIYIRKPDKQRPLSIPTVRDRILQTAITDYLTPILEPHFEAVSFAYRKGKSVDQAIQRVIQHYQSGFQWVVDADIRSYFDEVNHKALLDLLASYLDRAGSEHTEQVLWLIRLWLECPVQDGDDRLKKEKGIAQGSPVSPLLSNLFLDQLDDALLARNKRIVRFADDFLILCKSRKQAEQCLKLTGEILADLQLEMNQEKTHITHFDQGFQFLGRQFIRSLVFKPHNNKTTPVAKKHQQTDSDETGRQCAPASARTSMSLAWQKALEERQLAGETDQASEPAMAMNATPVATEAASDNQGIQLDSVQKTLYLTRDDLLVRKKSQRLILEWNDQKQSIPLISLDQILVFGNAQFTTPAIRSCLRKRVVIHFLSGTGRYQGQIYQPDLQRCLLHKAQYRRQDRHGSLVADRFSVDFGRALIKAKLHNSVTVLRRLKRRSNPHLSDMIQQSIHHISRHSQQLDVASSLDKLMGLEGACAKAYFSALGTFFSQQGWQWQGRQTRPARDPLNVLFNFLYSMLYNNVLGLIMSSGMNPYIGYLHSMQTNHAALASDLMEPFRSIIADQVILSCVREQAITPADFEQGPDFCELNRDAITTLVERFELRFKQQLVYKTGRTEGSDTASCKLDMRRIVADQISQTKAWIKGDVCCVNFFMLK